MWKTFCNVNLKGPADRQTAAFKRKIREYVKSGGDVEDGDDIVSAQAVSPVKVCTYFKKRSEAQRFHRDHLSICHHSIEV